MAEIVRLRQILERVLVAVGGASASRSVTVSPSGAFSDGFWDRYGRKVFQGHGPGLGQGLGLSLGQGLSQGLGQGLGLGHGLGLGAGCSLEQKNKFEISSQKKLARVFAGTKKTPWTSLPFNEAALGVYISCLSRIQQISS